MSPIQPARRSPLVDQVIAQLRAHITSGEWPVGSRIPTEPELVEQFGVARNTVREAVRALAHAGLLDIRQGAGTFVRATSELAEVMRRRFADAPLGEIVELRRALEVEAARLAAQRRTARDMVVMDAALARREAAWQSGSAADFVEADAALHQALVAAAHNGALAGLYADLGQVVRAALRASVGQTLHPDRYVDHAPLVRAIHDGDAERAAAEAAVQLAALPHALACRLVPDLR